MLRALSVLGKKFEFQPERLAEETALNAAVFNRIPPEVGDTEKYDAAVVSPTVTWK
jgi:hypothetical protein